MKGWFEQNHDGAGMAWRGGGNEAGKVLYSKGYFNFDEFYEIWKDLPFPKVAHMRWATHGGVSQELTQPFPVTPTAGLALIGSAELLLFHNGVWGDHKRDLKQAILSGQLKAPRGPVSDSRVMAMLAGRFGPRVVDWVDLSGDKVLIFGANTVKMWGSWLSHKEGWSQSNHSSIYKGSSAIVVRDFRGARGRARDKELPQTTWAGSGMYYGGD